MYKCKRLYYYCFLSSSIISFAGQIAGATPALPGMFPNMFPIATGQVSPLSSLSLSLSLSLTLTHTHTHTHTHTRVKDINEDALIFINNVFCWKAAIWSSSCYASSGNDSTGLLAFMQ